MRPQATFEISFHLTRSKRLPEDQIPYSREALRQDLTGCEMLGKIAKPPGIATRFMDTSAPCSTL